MSVPAEQNITVTLRHDRKSFGKITGTVRVEKKEGGTTTSF